MMDNMCMENRIAKSIQQEPTPDDMARLQDLLMNERR
jgi:hypothetical protein